MIGLPLYGGDEFDGGSGADELRFAPAVNRMQALDAPRRALDAAQPRAFGAVLNEWGKATGATWRL